MSATTSAETIPGNSYYCASLVCAVSERHAVDVHRRIREYTIIFVRQENALSDVECCKDASRVVVSCRPCPMSIEVVAK